MEKWSFERAIPGLLPTMSRVVPSFCALPIEEVAKG
jgi:hypothetical protein